jgi:hypothetical protein
MRVVTGLRISEDSIPTASHHKWALKKQNIGAGGKRFLVFFLTGVGAECCDSRSDRLEGGDRPIDRLSEGHVNVSYWSPPTVAFGLGDFLSRGGQVRTVSPVDVEAVRGPKLLEIKPPMLQLESALPSKLSGPYTDLSLASEIVPGLAALGSPKSAQTITFRRRYVWAGQLFRSPSRRSVMKASLILGLVVLFVGGIGLDSARAQVTPGTPLNAAGLPADVPFTTTFDELGHISISPGTATFSTTGVPSLTYTLNVPGVASLAPGDYDIFETSTSTVHSDLVRFNGDNTFTFWSDPTESGEPGNFADRPLPPAVAAIRIDETLPNGNPTPAGGEGFVFNIKAGSATYIGISDVFVPELDPNGLTGALTLLIGSVLWLTDRRRRRAVA